MTVEKNINQHMKRVLIILILLFVTLSASAQLFSREKIKNIENFDKQRVSWGFYLGLNSYDYQFNYEQDQPDILVDNSIGFSVGLSI